MRVLFSLNHPAHYHMFKRLAKMLQEDGHETQYVICNKDVLEDLLKSDGVPYVKLQQRRHRKSSALSVMVNGVVDMLEKDWLLMKYVGQHRPDIMIGTDLSIGHVGLLKGIPSLFFNEDDYEINKAACLLSYPFVSGIVAPDVCNVGRSFERKKIPYRGYQKLAYIHPKYFTADYQLVKKYIGDVDTYFILRLVSLTAGHDISGKHQGIDNSLLDCLITLLESRGKVLISSERPLAEKYQKYQLNAPASCMHHLMQFATLFIADSQSMCFEAGLMGVPYIRFNDFVGKISVLNQVENEYQLGYGVRTCDAAKLLQLADDLTCTPNLKEQWRQKKERLFQDKIDVNLFWKWLIENYPQSRKNLQDYKE